MLLLNFLPWGLCFACPRMISAGILQGDSTCHLKLKAWLARETQLPQGVPSKAAASLKELLEGGGRGGGGRTKSANTCRTRERPWLSTTVSLGSHPSGGRGRQKRPPRTGLHCPVRVNSSQWAPPAGPNLSGQKLGGRKVLYIHLLPSFPVC